MASADSPHRYECQENSFPVKAVARTGGMPAGGEKWADSTRIDVRPKRNQSYASSSNRHGVTDRRQNVRAAPTGRVKTIWAGLVTESTAAGSAAVQLTRSVETCTW